MAKACHLCATGVPLRGSRHGYRHPELGMLDFGCPSTKEGIEQDLETVRRALTKHHNDDGPAD